jgi:hypothetical protein
MLIVFGETLTLNRCILKLNINVNDVIRLISGSSVRAGALSPTNAPVSLAPNVPVHGGGNTQTHAEH